MYNTPSGIPVILVGRLYGVSRIVECLEVEEFPGCWRRIRKDLIAWVRFVQ